MGRRLGQAEADRRLGGFSGTYTTPKKAGTSTFIAQVDKVRRKHKGTTYTCRALRSTGASVTTSG